MVSPLRRPARPDRTPAAPLRSGPTERSSRSVCALAAAGGAVRVGGVRCVRGVRLLSAETF